MLLISAGHMSERAPVLQQKHTAAHSSSIWDVQLAKPPLYPTVPTVRAVAHSILVIKPAPIMTNNRSCFAIWGDDDNRTDWQDTRMPYPLIVRRGFFGSLNHASARTRVR